jgi:hypothetical protein
MKKQTRKAYLAGQYNWILFRLSSAAYIGINRSIKLPPKLEEAMKKQAKATRDIIYLLRNTETRKEFMKLNGSDFTPKREKGEKSWEI